LLHLEQNNACVLAVCCIISQKKQNIIYGDPLKCKIPTYECNPVEKSFVVFFCNVTALISVLIDTFGRGTCFSHFLRNRAKKLIGLFFFMKIEESKQSP